MLDTARGSVLAWLLHVAAILLLSLTLGWHFFLFSIPLCGAGSAGAELLLQPFSGLPPRALCLWATHAVRRSRAHVAAAAVLLHPAPARLPLFAAWLIGSVLTGSAGICLRPPDGPVVVKLCAAPFLTSGTVTAAELARWETAAEPERRARWQQFRRPDDRARSICADHLARTLLREAGAADAVIRVGRNRQALCARRPGLQLQPLRELRVLRRARRPCRHRS